MKTVGVRNGLWAGVLAATSRARRVARAPPRECPQMVTVVTGRGKVRVERDWVRRGVGGGSGRGGSAGDAGDLDLLGWLGVHAWYPRRW